MKGRIEKVIDHKNFSFIRGEDKSSYFLHKDDYAGEYTQLEEDYYRGIPVIIEFEPESTLKGLRAKFAVREEY